MIFLPVVERELRVAARRRGTYWGRFVAAMLGATLAAWVLLATEDSNEKAGADLFAVVSTVVFLYATVAGTLVTCDCLSEEKRDGTLGLLFLTDLKGYDIALGKLVATSVNAFYGMLAVLPMLAIPFILGGVSHAQMLRVVLVAMNLLFFFLSIGLFVSSLCRKDNWALGWSAMLGLMIVATGPIASGFESGPALFSSPAASCFLAFDEVYAKTNHALFWVNVVVTLLYSCIFFGLACWLVPRLWQDQVSGVKKSWLRRVDPARRIQRRTALLEINPFLWRVARSKRKRLLVWLTLALLTLIWSRYFHLIFPLIRDPGVGFLLVIPAGFILKAWIAAEASRTFSEDRRSGGMELLLTTPMHERDIVRGQMLSLWRQFAWPTAAVFLANFAYLLLEFHMWDSEALLLKMRFLLGGFLLADMIALSWVGAWLGLINRKPNRAALLALAQIVALPSGSFVVILCLLNLVFPRRDMQEGTLCLLWLLLGLAADLYFGLAARAKLRGEFRTVVSEGFKRKAPAERVPKSTPALMEAQ